MPSPTNCIRVLQMHRKGMWTNRQWKVLIGLLIGLIAFLVVRSGLNTQRIPNPQPDQGVRATELADRINPNTADWQTLAALPNIGEKRAKDIVAFRDAYSSTRPGELAFAKPKDLMQIRGIGEVIVQSLEPYLIFDKP
jgi:hypothetical protein